MGFKSILNPSASVTTGVATMAAVYGVYQLTVGSVAVAQATDANHPVLATSRRKAGLAAMALVGAITLITKDANILILGGGSIIGMELLYRTAIMAHPESGRMMNPNPDAAYMPAQSVVPTYAQGETG